MTEANPTLTPQEFEYHTYPSHFHFTTPTVYSQDPNPPKPTPIYLGKAHILTLLLPSCLNYCNLPDLSEVK